MPIPLVSMTSPYPRWYDPNARCEYHVGAICHSTDNGIPLRAKIATLIKYGWLKLEKDDQPPNVNTNPLPNHNGGGNARVNIMEVEEQQAIMNVDDMKTHMKVIFEILMKTDFVKTTLIEPEMQLNGLDVDKKCEYHQRAIRHSIEEYTT